MSVDQSAITQALGPGRARIAGTIKNAATATGTSFEYLVSTAKMESNLDPSAQASTSSARGLFQFIEQTWLGTVKEAGGALGLGKYADAIDKSGGEYSVRDPAKRAEILKLRDDPAINAAMAGVLTQSNSFKLTGQLGRRPTDSELYMAHFMGISGATRLISNAQDNPQASGPSLFPSAARANRSIFYNRNGSARTVSEVYSHLNARYLDAASSQTTINVLTAGGFSPTANKQAPLSSASIDNAAYLSSFPQARRADLDPARAALPDSKDGPIFRSLFQAGERAEPVSSAVRELWGNNSSLTSDQQNKPKRAPQPLDLFSDPKGVFSGLP